MSFALPLIAANSSSMPSLSLTAQFLFAATAAAAAATTAPPDLKWYAPSSTPVTNLTGVLTGSGTWGFLFNGSETPPGAYGTYNWCNMPHVRRAEYPRAPSEYNLQFVEVIHRHHKRTPYASNAFPVESYPWNCPDTGLMYTAERVTGSPPSAKAYLLHQQTAQNVWRVTPTSASWPGWQGTCVFPQLTAGGLDDSYEHGADLYGVYHELLGFLPARADEAAWRARVRYRVTNNKITSQVAGMLVMGMWRSRDPVPLLIEPDGIDALEPQMPCAVGSALFRDITSSANAAWAAHLAAAAPLFDRLDAVSGVPGRNSSANDGGFHASFDHYYDNLSARQCHGKPLPCRVVNGRNDSSACISQADADAVYRLGNWEYAQMYRGAAASLDAAATTFGTWIATLADHLRAAAAGTGGPVVYWHNIAHDGSLARLLAVLQADDMVWPGMGTEVVFELYKKRVEDGAEDGGYYVRVLLGGQVFVSSNPSLGTIDMLPIDTLLGYFDGLTGVEGRDVFGRCNGSIPL